MSTSNWNQRFFSSTRGRIVTLLRRASQTVDELAQALHLTDNAVRAHLATLERDGYVKQQGARRSASKPAYVYELGPAAEQLFRKAYEPVLQQLLAEVSARLSPEEMDATLRSVGRRIAHDAIPQGDTVNRVATQHVSASTLRERLEIALIALNE